MCALNGLTLDIRKVILIFMSQPVRLPGANRTKNSTCPAILVYGRASKYLLHEKLSSSDVKWKFVVIMEILRNLRKKVMINVYNLKQ